MPRFVVLEHATEGGRHWDFMLQAGSALATWTVAGSPDGAGPISARVLPDHRIEYLDYEGPISGGRGSVTRWDAGEYRLDSRSAAELTVTLAGRKLVGRVTLRRTSDAADQWQFSFTPE